MKAAPWFAMYPNDFLAAVGHLGNSELGIYWRLLLVYYRDGGPLPFDSDRLRRLALAFTPEEHRSLDAVVAEFFVLSTEPDGRRAWRHRRADHEMSRAAEARRKKSEAARGTNTKRWGNSKSMDSAGSGSLTESPSESLSDSLSGRESEPQPLLKEEKAAAHPSASPQALPKGKKKRSPLLTFAEWKAVMGAAGEKLIADDDAIFTWAENTGVPREYIFLAWRVFKRRYAEEVAEKTNRDWRLTFRRHVMNDWLNVWRTDAQGNCFLTTAGAQEQRLADREVSA